MRRGFREPPQRDPCPLPPPCGNHPPAYPNAVAHPFAGRSSKLVLQVLQRWCRPAPALAISCPQAFRLPTLSLPLVVLTVGYGDEPERSGNGETRHVPEADARQAIGASSAFLENVERLIRGEPDVKSELGPDPEEEK